MNRLTARPVDAINRPGKCHDGDAGLYLYVQERNGRLRKHSLHPRMNRLLEEFGDRDDVLQAVGSNIRSYCGWGHV